MILKKMAIGISALMMSQASFAYKECKDLTIGYIFNDGGNTFIGHTPDTHSLNGKISSSLSEYKTLVSIALTARTTGKNVTIRFVDNDVTCGSTIWSDQIQSIGF